jgi:hypothetical protein
MNQFFNTFILETYVFSYEHTSPENSSLYTLHPDKFIVLLCSFLFINKLFKKRTIIDI